MYVKINLLPKSYYEAKSARQLCILFGIIALLLIGAGIFWQMKINQQVKDLEEKIAIANGFKQQIDAIESEIAQRQQEVAYYQVRVDAIEGVLDFNKTIPAPFFEVAKWTYEKVQYTSLSISGTNVAIRGRARSLNDIARYILNLYKAKDTFNPGTISLAIDGMGSSSPTGMPGGMPGSMPGMSGGMPGMPGGPAGPMPGGSQTSAAAIVAPAMGPTPSGVPGGMPGMSDMPGVGDMMNSTLGNSFSGNWINFTVSAQLKKGLPTHSFSLQSGNSGSVNGMGYGMDGMSGGMPGMPGGPGMTGGMPGMPGDPGMTGGMPGMPGGPTGPMPGPQGTGAPM